MFKLPRKKGQKHNLRDQPVLVSRRRRERLLPLSGGCKQVRKTPSMAFRALLLNEGVCAELVVAL
jgi:hypothetical protein